MKEAGFQFIPREVSIIYYTFVIFIRETIISYIPIIRIAKKV